MLPEDKRIQLDGIVNKMTQNKESDDTIQFVVDDFKKKYDTSPISTAITTPSDQIGNPLFPAKSDEGVLTTATKTIGNIPSSAVGFAKNLFDFFNPLNTLEKVSQIPSEAKKLTEEAGGIIPAAKAFTKELPKATYETLVPSFMKNLFSGKIDEARKDVENDPVGQIAPLIMLGRGMAEKMGKVVEFDNAISTVAKPITKPIGILKKGVGEATSQALGVSTGAGASSIKEVFGAAKEGNKALTDLTKAMRGEIRPEDIIQNAQDIVQTIKDNRRTSYISDLKKIGEDKTTHDISPVITELNKQLNNFGLTDELGVVKEKNGILDFSRSSVAKTASARTDIQGVYETIKDWGTKAGDRTGIGLDLLKKQLDDFYSPSSQARSFVQAVKNKVSGILNKEVSGYKEMVSKYGETSNLLDEIKSATGVGTKAKSDTIFTKITTAMKRDNQFRLDVLKEMEMVDKTLMNKIAGANLSSWMPQGLVGRFADFGAVVSALYGVVNPRYIPMMLMTSPRIVGEFLRTSGMATNKISTIINYLNKIKNVGVPSSLGATVQENQKRKK
jgi:hypothetical protein